MGLQALVQVRGPAAVGPVGAADDVDETGQGLPGHRVLQALPGLEPGLLGRWDLDGLAGAGVPVTPRACS